jgi:hypothetical protein
MSALSLVKIGKDGNFELDGNTLKKLSQLEGPVAVISIAGLYRTGKSYLLNRLLGRQSGFAVGPSVNPCTKGIFVWGDPPKRNGVNIILLDTEGLGSTQQDQAYDTKIFSLALLLSSYFIYNSMGTIDERALEGLHLVTNLTKHISTKSNTPMSSFMPNFIWCLRDFSLKLEFENGQPMTEAQYLENALNFIPTQKTDKDNKKSDEKNSIRECIKTFFPRRDCACLVRPTNEESELQRVDSISETKLRPQFVKQMSALTEKILTGVQPKRIMNQSVTGERFVMLLQNYVNAFNSGMAPEILGTWESIALLENQKIVKSELGNYEKGLATAMKNSPLDDATLTKTNNALKLAAMNSIQKNGLGEDVSELLEEFEKFSAEIYRKFEKVNLKASNETNSKLLQDLYNSFILQKLKQNEFADVNKLSTAWDGLEVHFQKLAKGSQASRLQTLNEFLGKKKNESFSLYTEHVAKINQTEIVNLKKIILEVEKNAKETEKKLQASSSEKHAIELNSVKSTEELKMLKERYQELLNKIKEHEKRNEDQSQEHKNSNKKYETRIGELEEKIKESKAKEKKIESSHAEAKERIKKYENELESSKKEIAQLRESERKSESSLGDAKERLKKYESDVDSLKKQLLETDKKSESNDAGMKNTLKKKESEIELLEKEVRSLKENDKRSDKIKETLREREGEVEELKKEVKQLREFEKRHESGNQDWSIKLKKKDSEIELLEKEIRLLKTNEKNYEKTSTDVKATMRKYVSDISSLKSEKVILNNKLSGYELEMKEMRHSNEKQVSSLQKEFNERLKVERDQNNLLRLNNDRLTSENRELENSNQQQQHTPIRHSPTNQNMKKNTKKSNGSAFSFEQPQFLNDNNYNEIDEEVPQATNNQFQKLNPPVVSSPSKKRKQPTQLVEEEEPASKKQKKTTDDLNRFTVVQLRQKIKDIDYTKLPMSTLPKAKLIEILESLL